MKLSSVSISALYAGLFFSGAVQAFSANTIQFIGEIADQTCNVSVNGSHDSPVVLLPTVSKSELNSAAKTAGAASFTIKITGCAAEPDDQAIKARFIANHLTASKRIGNTGDASNVSLEIFDPRNAAVTIDHTGITPAPGLFLPAGATEAAYDYGVRYYAEGAATAGSVAGSVQYALSYR